jgi:hypothetical protein
VGISNYIQSVVESIDEELAKPQQKQSFVLVARYGILDGHEHGNVLIRDDLGTLIQSPNPTISQIAKFNTTEEAQAARAAWLLRYPTSTVEVMEYADRLRKTRAFLIRQIDAPAQENRGRASMAGMRAAITGAIAAAGFALSCGYAATADNPDLYLTMLDSSLTPFFVDGSA